ncbi:MAG: hypothetical protein N3E51_03780, partial [Candidatus Micrarchaeota archaeon]|nr:hypothetical protein [Candidatus Micrarchaeota archaeon]
GKVTVYPSDLNAADQGVVIYFAPTKEELSSIISGVLGKDNIENYDVSKVTLENAKETVELYVAIKMPVKKEEKTPSQ